ncbi:hypothetical protein [Hyalangium rubrum]|uniref:Prolyl 4-hydroxylase alpha subunit domain-containing protein n=1 Tax=Hyalangium rubrum TaxID=3103134 RepID=A0ABU5HC42_9BACT|nr:hypothetical protein [Hyalangium sp. s54d21]MDY7230459.1 hypothetical protein [Hyalangium sp. s54d21]
MRRDGEQWQSIFLASPIKGRDLRIKVVNSDNPSLFEAVREIVQSGEIDADCIARHEADLTRLGVLIGAAEVSRPVVFHCWLTEPESGERAGHASHEDADLGDLVGAPVLVYQPPGTALPDVLRERVLLEKQFAWGAPESWFAPGCGRLWVEDPGTRILAVFSVPAHLESIVASLRPDEPPPSSLTAETSRLLRRANVLVTRGFAAHRAEEWERTCDEARRRFASDGFVNVEGLLHPLQLVALRHYLREFVAEGHAELTKEETVCYGAHNEGVCRYLHHQLSGLVGRIVGREIKPSYTYFRTYRPGAVLERHLDREPSHYSISFLVDYTPESADRSPWPLCLEPGSGGVVPVFQRRGDGVFFEGIKVPHFRDRLAAGCTSTSVFFEYVPKEYSGPLR